MGYKDILNNEELNKIKEKLKDCEELQGINIDYDEKNNQIVVLSFYDVEGDNYLDYIHKIQSRVKELLGVDIDPVDYAYDGGVDWYISYNNLKKLKEVRE